ncbi:MAG: phosphatidate cytidylyltransferase [Dehalococcoidia bacterium]|nr:phosphatidate cytidylyltransferase [Dehalococcoidia bacterium]
MTRRLITAAIGLPILLAAIWLGAPWLTVLIAVIALFGMWEFGGLSSGLGAPPTWPLMIAWGLAFILDAHFGGGNTAIILSAGLVASLTLRTLRAWRPTGVAPPADAGSMASTVTGWALTITGTLYIGWALAHGVLLRALPGGREWIIVALAIVFATDTTAFFAGKFFGRHQLAPAISPGKTWEGAAGGFLGAVFVGAAATSVFSLPIALWQVVLLSSSISIAAQIGDLAESMLKRAARTKESGALLPGHGGVLDRLDSVVLSLVVAYYAIQWMTM